MLMNYYQKEASQTAIYDQPLAYPGMGLSGEGGEFMDSLLMNAVKLNIAIGKTNNKGKKILRDQAAIDKTKAELGDVLWYVAAIARDLGVDLEEVAHENLAKLRKRKEAGTLQGDGDNR